MDLILFPVVGAMVLASLVLLFSESGFLVIVDVTVVVPAEVVDAFVSITSAYAPWRKEPMKSNPSLVLTLTWFAI